MGTNYYLKPRPAHVCPSCGHRAGDETNGLHIGKASAGWAFSLRIYPEPPPQSEGSAPYHDVGAIVELANWIPLFKRYGIVDEYGDDVEMSDMLTKIRERTWHKPLSRHAPESGRCVGPGADGTYDLMLGEFS